jgi:Ca2+-binding RTX toxin-like protein
LLGGNGNDSLVGSSGSDLLTGGKGNDTLSLGNNDGSDIVKQFVRGKGGDLLSFSGIANIDVVKLGTNTEFRTSDGIVGNIGFGSGDLLLTLQRTTGFNALTISNSLSSSNTSQLWFS